MWPLKPSSAPALESKPTLRAELEQLEKQLADFKAQPTVLQAVRAGAMLDQFVAFHGHVVQAIEQLQERA